MNDELSRRLGTLLSAQVRRRWMHRGYTGTVRVNPRIPVVVIRDVMRGFDTRHVNRDSVRAQFDWEDLLIRFRDLRTSRSKR